MKLAFLMQIYLLENIAESNSLSKSNLVQFYLSKNKMKILKNMIKNYQILIYSKCIHPKKIRLDNSVSRN